MSKTFQFSINKKYKELLKIDHGSKYIPNPINELLSKYQNSTPFKNPKILLPTNQNGSGVYCTYKMFKNL